MAIDKDTLPVSYLLFTPRGRINRLTYWQASLFIWLSFYVLFNALGFVANGVTLIIYPVLFWALFSTASKRLHDVGWSSKWLGMIFIPVAGALFLLYLLGFRKGKVVHNRHGMPPHLAPDYFKNPDATPMPSGEHLVDDVTQINPIAVSSVEVPTTVEEVQQIIKQANKPICIGGGRFSMGGQTASAGAT